MMYFIHNSHHPENGGNSGRNMLLRKLWIKYIVNIVVHIVGYLYIKDPLGDLMAPKISISAAKRRHVKYLMFVIRFIIIIIIIIIVLR